MARRKFAREFKISAVKLVNEQGYSIGDAAKSLGIEPGTVRYWVEKFSGQALLLLQQGGIEVFVSRPILKELRAVLQYPTVRQKLPNLENDRIDCFLRQLAFRATFLRNVRHVFDYPRATQDEPYIDLAAAARANYLVSRDRDLLSLATDNSLLGKQFRQRYPHLHVLNPVAFLADLKAQTS